LRRRRQIVELDDRVGLRPHAELARLLERPVVRVDDLGVDAISAEVRKAWRRATGA